MNTLLLEHRIKRLWQIYKITPTATVSIAHRLKLKSTMAVLAKAAEEHQIPIGLIVNEYAFHYTFLSKETSFHKIFVKTGPFVASFAKPVEDINDTDIALAYEVEEAWNKLHKIRANNVPFLVWEALSRHNLWCGQNTFFQHSANFRDFCIVANFIRHNRRYYPQISSIVEFFLHQPIQKGKPGKYCLFYYRTPTASLEGYYKMMYGPGRKEDRFAKFKETAARTEVVAEHKDMWGYQEMEKEKHGKQ